MPEIITFPKKETEERNKILAQLKIVNENIATGLVLSGKYSETSPEYMKLEVGLEKLYWARSLLLIAFDIINVKIKEYYESKV